MPHDWHKVKCDMGWRWECLNCTSATIFSEDLQPDSLVSLPTLIMFSRGPPYELGKIFTCDDIMAFLVQEC
jgi:hypothetical protein